MLIILPSAAGAMNSGDRAGKDVIEIYSGAPDGVLENPKAELYK